MTRFRISLRARVTIAITALGALLSILFAFATIEITETYEHILIEEILSGQAEDYSLRLESHPDATLPQSHRLSGYLLHPDGSGDVPVEFLALNTGINEIEKLDSEGHGIEDEDVHVGVFDTPQGRLFFVIDISDIEQLEVYLEGFLLMVVVLGTAISGWLGWMLAGNTIDPARRLAAAVDALPVRPEPTRLAQSMARDELGRLATAIDAYQARMVEADAAERRFFADASHELRTPVAVVRGAVELMLEDPVADAGAHRRLRRLDRGVGELTDLLDVLLGLVQRRQPEVSTVPATPVLRECIDSLLGSAEAGDVAVEIRQRAELAVPQREAHLIVTCVLRRLLPPGASGVLTLTTDTDGIELDYRATDAAGFDAPAHSALRSDHGLGLTLVGRLASQLGWRIEESGSDSTRRGVRIRVSGAVDISC